MEGKDDIFTLLCACINYLRIGEPVKDYPTYGVSILCKLNPKAGIFERK
jgi:hypothetical protein